MFDPDNTAMRDLVVALIDAGADVNKPDAENWTPLYQAASAGDLGNVTTIKIVFHFLSEIVQPLFEYVTCMYALDIRNNLKWYRNKLDVSTATSSSSSSPSSFVSKILRCRQRLGHR